MKQRPDASPPVPSNLGGTLAYAALTAVAYMLWTNPVPAWAAITGQPIAVAATNPARLVPSAMLNLLLLVPAGALVDRVGIRRAVGWAAVVLTAGAMLRVHTVAATLVAGQLGISLGFPVIAVAIFKVGIDWFRPRRRGLAYGLGFAGIALGNTLHAATDANLITLLGLRGSMVAQATAAAVCATAFWRLVPRRLPLPGPGGATHGRVLVLVMAVAAVILSCFVALTIWWIPMLEGRGMHRADELLADLPLWIGAVVGTLAMAAAMHRLGRPRTTLILLLVTSAVVALVLCADVTGTLAFVLAGVFGMTCFAAMVPLTAVASLQVGQQSAGRLSALLLLVASLAALAVAGSGALWVTMAGLVFPGLLVCGALLATRLPDRPSARASHLST